MNFFNYTPAAVGWEQTHTRSKSSGNSKFFKNRKTLKKPKRDLSKYKHGSTFKRRSSRSASNISPVAVISNADHSQKIALIPINLFEGKRNDEEAFEKALAIVTLLRENGRQVELFADNCSNLKIGERRFQPDRTFDQLMPQSSGGPSILTEFEGHDEATFLIKQEKRPEEGETDYMPQIPAVSFTTENNDLPAKIASQLREIPVSGMQLNFEMDMTNVKEALLNPSNLPGLPPTRRSLENSTLALSTNVRMDSADTKTVPLHFNALIEGIVEVDPKEFSNEKLRMLKVPQFNEYVTAIAANLCSTALRRGFPTDVSRKFYSTTKTPSDNDVTVKNMLERYDQFRNERNARKAQMSTKSSEYQQGNDAREIYSKFTTARGLLDCNLYQKSLEVVARKRKETPAPSSFSLAPKSRKQVTAPKGQSGPRKFLSKSPSADGPSSKEPKSTSYASKTISKNTGSKSVSGLKSKATSICEKTSSPSISVFKPEAKNPNKKSPSRSRSSSQSRSKGPCKKTSSASISGSRQEAKAPSKKAPSDSVRKSPCRPCREASLASKSSNKSTAKSPCGKVSSTLKSETTSPSKKASASKSGGESPCKKASSTLVSGSKSEGANASPCKKASSSLKSEATSPCKKASASKPQSGSPCKKATSSITGPKSKGTSPCKKASSLKSEATSPCKKASASKPQSGSPCKKATSPITGPKSKGTSPCKKASSFKSEATSPCKKASALKPKGKSPCKKQSSASRDESPCKKTSSSTISGSKAEGTSPCKKTSPASKATSPCKKASVSKSRSESLRKKTSSASLCGSKSKTSPDSKSGSKSQIKCGRPAVGDTSPKCKKSPPISKCGSMKSNFKKSSKTSSSASKCGSNKDTPLPSSDSKKACKRAAKAKCGSQKNLAKDASSLTHTPQSKVKPPHGCTKPKCSDYRCPSCSTTRDVHTLTTLLAPFAIKVDPSSRNYSRKCPDDPKNTNLPDSARSNEYRRDTCEKLSWKDNKHSKERRNKPKNCYPEETQEFCPDTACYKASKYSKKGNKKPKANCALLMPASQHCHQSTNARTNQEAIIEAPYKIGMQSHSIPRIFDNDILVAVDSVALSDSDIHMFETGSKYYPEVTLGNEASGVVQKIGRNVHHVKIGDHVAIESAIPCRRCDLCKKGHYNLCNWMTFNGCLSKYCIHPGAFCYRINKEIPMERAAMVHQLALGCNASHQARIKPNSNVAIIGSCAMTVCAAICAHSLGASNICVMCGSPNTEDIIEGFVTQKVECFDGKVNESALAEKIFDSLGTLPDIVINCSSCTKTMNAAIMALKPTGTCVIAGFHSECASFNIMDALVKEIRIIPSYRSKNMFPLAINLLESGRAPIDGLISNCCRWDELEAAFLTALSEGNNGPRKVIVQCQLGDGKVKAA